MSDDLMKTGERESDGEILYYKFFEVFIVANAVKLAWHWAEYIQRLQEVVHPLGLARYVDISAFYDSPLAYWNAGAITVLGLLVILTPWRWTTGLLVLLLHLQLVARDTLGEISHSANFIGMSLVAIALAQVFYAPGTERRRFAIGITIFFVGFGYVSAASCKLIGTGFDWPDGHHLWMWIAEKGTDILSREGSYEPNVVQQLALSSWSMATVMLTFGLITEALGFLLWFRKYRLWIALALIAMHIGISMSMRIRFDVFIYELALIGLPWIAWFDYAAPRLPFKTRLLEFCRGGYGASTKSS